MRTTLALLVLAALAVLAAATTFAPDAARADDPPAEAADEVEALAQRVATLEDQVAYLVAREADLTAWALASEERSRRLAAALARARREGFTQAAISSTSREALLAGLEAHATALGADLPAVTKEQQALRVRSEGR